MAKKLKAGVIGLGMGGGHLAGYLTHPDVEVVAIADRHEIAVRFFRRIIRHSKAKSITKARR